MSTFAPALQPAAMQCVIAPPREAFDLVLLLVSIALMLFISVTLLLRGNDYRRRSTNTWVAYHRMSGFVLGGFMSLVVILWWLATGNWPSVPVTLFLFGVSQIFFTSENMPPYWEWIQRGINAKAEKARLRAERAR